ncbi:MAG: hypothetical protein HC819_22010, partial [Cyclobacteriaceae bacterium]|nr:hypothetical protein [Cyclobacteriaceae bacterium]
KRTLAKSIIKTPCDLKVNHEDNTLNITLHTLATPRDNDAVKKSVIGSMKVIQFSRY